MIKNTFSAKEVARLLEVSTPTANRYIKRMNDELEAEGYFTITGKVPIKLFQEKFPYHDISENTINELMEG